MAKWQGTPVPNTGYVENVYFNTALSIEEVENYLSKLSYIKTDFAENKVSPLLCSTQPNIIIFALVLETGNHLICTAEDLTSGNYEIIYDYGNGFKIDVLNINNNLTSELLTIPIGTQNNLLSSLFSITPFVKDVSLNSFLTGIADAIRTKTETTEPINAQDFATEILNIKTGDTETEDGIVTRTITSYTNNRISTIGAYAFATCGALSEVTFINCKTIGASAFNDCKKLKTANIPDCEYIGTGAFSSCDILTEINFSKCLEIASSAFYYCSGIKTASFPKCRSVYSGAFNYCKGMLEIELPICFFLGDRAFFTCSSLVSAFLPSVISLYSATFYGCSSLKNVYLRNCITIESGCFNGCTSLDKLSLFTYYARFSSNAFNSTPMSNSSYLGYFGSIYVPTNAVSKFKSMTNWAVYSERITSLPSEYDSEYIYAYEFSSATISQIPDEKLNVKHVLPNAFRVASNLTTVNLPECVDVNYQAFAYCYSLSEVNLPKCKKLESTAFYKCSSLKTINIPSCEYIGHQVFLDCSILESVYANNCKYIGPSAFYGCSKLKYISSFDNCEYIGIGAFHSTDISEAIFPKCSIIPSSAFSSCYYLKMASFPNCIEISWYAFQKCSNFESLYLNVKSVVKLQDSNAFVSTPIADSSYLKRFGSIYVPTSLYESFKTAKNWSYYADRIVATDFTD